MNSTTGDVTDLETAIDTVYRGPLDEFIARRAAVAKQFRADRKRDEAAQVRTLRKPSRIAWALDQISFEDAAPIEDLAAAITAAQTQSGASGDVRQALEDVRAAVRAVANAGARIAGDAGHAIQTSSLIAAVHAVIGDADAFASLRTGRLVDVPEGGGLDILAAIALASPAAPKRAIRGEPVASKAADPADDARAELQRAETLLTEARARAQVAQDAVRSIAEKLATAEQQLQRARDHAEAVRAELDRARRETESAVAQADQAARALETIHSRQ